MNLFRISDKGELENIPFLDFKSSKIYLIDDSDKLSIYIWVGRDVLQYMKDIAAAYARRFEKERGQSTKIHIMKEGREFGSFLGMMEQLRKGQIPGKTTERRPELILEPSIKPKSLQKNLIEEEHTNTTEKRIKEWFVQLKTFRSSSPPVSPIQEDKSENLEDLDLQTQIREAAYYLSLERYSYNDLCWLLAEKIQNVNLGMPSLDDIRGKAEEVFQSSSTYDELCWLNAEMDILIIKGYIEKKKMSFDF